MDATKQTSMHTPVGKVNIGDVVAFEHRLNHVRFGTIVGVIAPYVVLSHVICVRCDEYNKQQVRRLPDCTIKDTKINNIL